MRFVMLIKSDAKAEAGVLPDQKLLTEMGKLNEEMVEAGVMLAGEGLQPSSKGARVRLAGKKFTVIDGPFAEAKELIAGFWLIQAKSLEDAIGWAKRVPDPSADPGLGAREEGEIEIRPLYEMSDFPVDPAEKPGGWREQEQRFRDATEPPGAAPAPPPRKRGTTRFMVMLKADDKTEASAPPSEKVLAAMGALMQEMVEAGALLSGEGLKATSQGARVRIPAGKRTATKVIDGPFTESKEIIAGYSIIQVPSRQEAIDFAKRWLQIHVEGLEKEAGEIEIRQIFELSDFPVDPAEKPDGWRHQEERLRERLGQ